ncbi:MAG TPA: glycosyltransferase family 2 protein [Euzebya sp.]|nr:glycosyltransferase family 2 protein [Euzebya sp.]
MTDHADLTDPTRPHVAAVMTVFNRKDDTLACLQSLHQQGGTRARITTFVVDDGSTDGTADAVAERFPDVRLLPGTGELYWNGGMRRAFGAALAEGFDFYWWLNDDVELDDDALTRLLDTDHAIRHDGVGPVILVGAMRHPDDGRTTYGGVRRHSQLRPLDFSLVEPSDRPVPVETMNGNCVLIPKEIAHNLGNIEPSYRQKMGDFDYGLRARQAGYAVWSAAGTLGRCATHPPRRTDTGPLWGEIRRLWSTKELPPRSWLVFTRRWAGPLWPVYWLSPYVRRAAALIAERLRR